MIGNKCDLDEEDAREVPFEEGERWVREYKEEMIEDGGDEIDIEFMEVSAKDGTNI